MSGLAITITDRGRAALIAARGTNPITITEVGVTAESFTPSATALTLPGEIKRLATFSGEASDAYTIHITLRDDSIDDYELRGFGLYLSDGTLFGIYGNGPALIMEKASQSMLLLAIDIAFTASDAKDISFGNTNFLNPSATTERQGVIELATESEAATGTDTARAVTPKAMLSAVKGWINDRFGNGAPSDFIKTILTSASALALRGALGLKSAALKDEGAGGGLDADKLDGQDGSYFANIAARLGYTPANRAGDAFTGPVSINGSVAWHAGNDGAGSGLDADLLDGLDSFYFTNIPARLGYTPVNKAGDTITGTLTINDGNTSYLTGNTLTFARPSANYFWANTAGGYLAFGGNGRATGGENANFYTNAADLGVTFNGGATFKGALFTNGNVIWNSGNDGAGSGLDADMLDGLDSSYFMNIPARLGYTPVNKAGDTITGTLTINDGNTSYLTGNTLIFARPSANYFWANTAGGSLIFGGNGRSMSMGTANFYTNAADLGVTFNGGATFNGALFNNGAAIWNSGNDGAGSGLDADMLDGYHASSFLDGKCAAYILFYVTDGNYYVVASSGATIQYRQQGGIFYFTVSNRCPIGFAIGMAAPISYSDGINVLPPAQRMNGNGESYHFEFKYTSSKSLTDPGWALVMWF
jgi:hypothetical protein